MAETAAPPGPPFPFAVLVGEDKDDDEDSGEDSERDEGSEDDD
jgi:hypothetical protein